MTTQRLTMPIYDLGCGGGGALMIEQAVARTPGVMAAYVNPATEMAYVTFDGERCSEQTVAAAITACGFRTGPAHGARPSEHARSVSVQNPAHPAATDPAASRRKLAELTGGIGASILGAGIALLLPASLGAYALPIIALGILMHSWSMLDKHRLERAAGAAQPRWAALLYWGCWLALLGLALVIGLGLR